MFGTSGSLDVGQEFHKWVLMGMDPDKFPKIEKGEFTGVGVIEGEIYEWTDTPKPVILKTDFMAWGNGKELAFGALAAGASVIQSIAIACDHSPGSDYPVQVLISPYQTDEEPTEPFLLNRRFIENNPQIFKLKGKKLFEFLSEQAVTSKSPVQVLSKFRRRSSVRKAKRK